MLSHLKTAILSSSVLCSSLVLAQDFTLSPRFGSTSLNGGFVPDPHIVSVLAGGAFQASNANSGCNGYVTDEPSYQLSYSPGSLGLGFYTNAEFDTTILINTPNGEWICNDDHDALENLNSGVYFEDPASGRYDIWVGAYSDSNNNRSAMLAITEYSTGSWETDLEPAVPELTLSGGFSPDPYALDIIAGGALYGYDDVTAFDCTGYYAGTATYRLNFTPGSLGLSIYTNADVDTTIAVQAPNGSWSCNDDNDFLENNNAGVYFASPASGSYNIYVGTFSESNSNSPALLAISEYSESSWEANIGGSNDNPVFDDPIPEIPDGEIQFGSKLF